MTNQEIFNKAYIGLASQGFVQSLNTDNNCVYRSNDGKRCAIGWCISDEDYDPTFEGNPPTYLPSNLFGVEETDYYFLEELQEIHDQNPMPKEMKESLHSIAEKYYLTVPNLEYEV